MYVRLFVRDRDRGIQLYCVSGSGFPPVRLRSGQAFRGNDKEQEQS